MLKPKRSTDAITLRDFWEAGKIDKKNMYLSFLIPVNALFLYTLAPFAIGKVLAELTKPNPNVTPYVIAFIIFAVLGVICNRIAFINFLAWQPKVMAYLQEKCMVMLLKRGTSFHNNNVSGKLTSDAIDYPSAYSQLSNTIFTNVMPFAVSIIFGLLLIALNSPLLGLLMFLMTTLVVGSAVQYRRKMAPARALRLQASKEVTSHMADTIMNALSVKTFGRESFELAEHAKRTDVLRQRRTDDWGSLAINGSNRIAALLIFQLGFVLVTIWLIRKDPTLLATGIFAFSYSVLLTNRLFDVGTMLRSFEESLQLAEPMTKALQEDHEVKDIRHAKKLKIERGSITFKDVSFHYQDTNSDNNVFDGFALSIKPGERVGLVGPSGGGKSTVTKLLLRFEDVQAGVIMADNQNIAEVTQQSLRQAIAYVPQESLLFRRTIRENIKYGNSEASHEMIIQAAKDAHAHDFILSLPKGYETVVGERGVKLSGGQRQRIAIARAMLKDAPILILDEATSALDSESEVAIQDALWRLMQNRTALVIAHRLSTIQHMDRIVLLDQGKVVEEGIHKELLKSGNLYARLWSHQSGGFLED